MSILDQFRGVRWAPRHGWRSDREVVLAVRAVITEYLGGEAEDILPSDGFVPDALGAVVAAPSRNGTPRPFVAVRAELPVGLRADLWAFGTALAVGLVGSRAESGAGGLLLVGRERHLVSGPGWGLAAALIVQRLGRRPGDCDFRVYRNMADLADPLRRAA